MSTLQLGWGYGGDKWGSEESQNGLDWEESGTSGWVLLKTGDDKGTVSGRLDEEGARLTKSSERGNPDMPVGWHLGLHLIWNQPTAQFLSLSLPHSPAIIAIESNHSWGGLLKRCWLVVS